MKDGESEARRLYFFFSSWVIEDQKFLDSRG